MSQGEEVVIAVDSTGIKVTKRGEWMRRKRKGYIKIHVAVDTRTKQVVSLEVSDELLTSHLSLFTFLASEGIEPCIKVRRDSLLSCGGVRGEVVRETLLGGRRG
jgi:hypothetical protein